MLNAIIVTVAAAALLVGLVVGLVIGLKKNSKRYNSS